MLTRLEQHGEHRALLFLLPSLATVPCLSPVSVTNREDATALAAVVSVWRNVLSRPFEGKTKKRREEREGEKERERKRERERGRYVEIK